MATEIINISPQGIAYLPKSLTDFLYKASQDEASDITVQDALQMVAAGTAELYAVNHNEELSGAALFMYGKSNKGAILDVAMLGGINIMKWADDIKQFAISKAQEHGCVSIWTIGRKGWGRVFKDMKPIGIVYELRVGG